MVNYQDGKIYKLVGGGLTYYGSTCDELYKRLYSHKQKSNKCKSKQLFDSGDKVEIILVEKFSCNDKMELHQRERYYIENNECINKSIPTRTNEEYREDNKDKIKEYNNDWRNDNKDYAKKYYENNKDIIKEQRKEYYECNKDLIKNINKEYRENNKDIIKEKKSIKITCECGTELTKDKLSRHKKSKKHNKFINK